MYLRLATGTNGIDAGEDPHHHLQLASGQLACRNSLGAMRIESREL